MTYVTITPAELRDFSIRALVASGVRPDHASDVAEVLVFADERGVSSHGTMALPHYIHHIESGGINVNPDVRMLAEGDAYGMVDADNSLGAVAATFATRIAIAKAMAAGVSTVTVRNSNHFGAGARYALMGVEDGMIGEVFSNVPPMMAPTGGRKRMLGTNPISIAVPAAKHPPLVLDMAMSSAAGGRIIGAAAANRTIPEGWLLDPSGKPTTDPQDYHRGGALLPFGGYKGYGLAMATEAIAGVLSGAGIATQVTSFRRDPTVPSHTGHTIRMTKIEAFMPLSEFADRMDFLIEEMKGSPKVEDASEILVPGELEARKATHSKSVGISLVEETFLALTELADRLRTPAPVGLTS